MFYIQSVIDNSINKYYSLIIGKNIIIKKIFETTRISIIYVILIY